MADFVDTYPLSPAERALLLLVWRHGAVTAQTAQAECNMTMWELGNTIRRLLAGWFVRREKGGHSKTVIYHITPLGMIAGEAASRGAEVSIVRRIKRRKNAAPVREMVQMRQDGATVREITDRLGYLNERTVRSHLRRVGLTGKPGRPRREVSA